MCRDLPWGSVRNIGNFSDNGIFRHLLVKNHFCCLITVFSSTVSRDILEISDDVHHLYCTLFVFNSMQYLCMCVHVHVCIQVYI